MQVGSKFDFSGQGKENFKLLTGIGRSDLALRESGKMAHILVTGGAGYIGSHTCLDLSNKGFVPVAYDNLSNGHAELVQWGPLEIGDIRDRERLDEVLRKHKPVAIVHFAAAIEV